MSTTTHQGAEGAEIAIANAEAFIRSAEAADTAITHNLAHLDWRPNRAHIEGARNAIRDATKAGRRLLALSTPAPRTDGGMTAGEVRTILARLWCQAEGNDPDGTISDAGHTVLDGTLGGLDKKAFAAITEAERAILNATTPPGGPRYQYREIGEGEGWKDCSRESYLAFASDPHIDTREVPATPAQPAGAVPDGLREAFEAADLHECWVNGDTADVMTNPYGHCGNFNQIVARCATGDLWRKRAVAIAESLNFVRTLVASHTAGQGEDDAERCIACNKLLKAGERVLPDAEGGTIHAACCGPERESYTGADSEPLGPNDPIPQGYVYRPAGQSAGSGAEGWQPIETAPKDGTRVDLWVTPHDAFANGNADRLEARWMERVGWVRIGGGYVSECGEPTHWRPRPGAPGKPAPNSTRTGAAETEEPQETARKIVDRIIYDRCQVAHHFRDDLIKAFATALAARPEAPSDAGWSFDMETAPRDGTVILLWREGWGEPSAAYWGLAPMACGASIASKRHPWVFLDSTNGVNGYEDGENGPTAWRSMLNAPTPPSDPAPSGQAEGTRKPDADDFWRDLEEGDMPGGFA